MGAIVIKTDKKKTHLISKLAKELGGNVISIDEEQYEDFLIGKTYEEQNPNKGRSPTPIGTGDLT